jgi:hypothetical protein
MELVSGAVRYECFCRMSISFFNDEVRVQLLVK